MIRRHITFYGWVQGVGFRYRVGEFFRAVFPAQKAMIDIEPEETWFTAGAAVVASRPHRSFLTRAIQISWSSAGSVPGRTKS